MSVSTTIEHVVDIDASPSTVYQLWTSSEGLTSWWGVVMRGEYTELDEPHKVAFTFGWEHEPSGRLSPGTTAVDVSIKAAGDGCRLTLRHAGLPIEHLASHATGWTNFLDIQRSTIK
jgi:uncharacterized protein YndB with AHSA1/START domain